ncbi:MAG: putative RNA uridine N3 methyltransferase [Fervidicoccaceae archaeon]
MFPIDIELLLPYCTLENEPDILRETIKANIIARYASIFRVSRILLYRSRRKKECFEPSKRFALLLNVFRTPPYLRRKIYGKRKELKYLGLAYPLQSPTHTVKPSPREGELREGLVEKVERGRILVDIGLRAPTWVEASETNRIKVGDVFLFRVTSAHPLQVERIESSDEWIGYEVKNVGYLHSYLKRVAGTRAVIGTSRLGEPIWENLRRVSEIMRTSGWKITLVFGEPYRGLYDIAKELSIDVNEYFNGIYNFVMNQGTRTVRTEEAIPIVLSVVSILKFSQ